MKKSELGVFVLSLLAISFVFIVASSQFGFVSATHNATHTNSTNQSLPDLTIVSLTVSVDQATGGVTPTAVVRNVGGATAYSPTGNPGLVITFNPFQGPTLPPQTGGVAILIPTPLAPNQQVQVSGAFFENTPGNYRILATADAYSRIGELNEGNNQFISSYYTVSLINSTNQTSNQTHRACVNNTCALVNGSGTNQCSTLGASCGNQTSICGNGIVESGEACDPPGSSISCSSQGVAGTRTCNAQCTSYGSCIIPYHNECRNVNGTKSCVSIPGNGTSQCRNDAGCQTGPLKGGNTGRESSAGVQFSPPSALFGKIICFFSSKC